MNPAELVLTLFTNDAGLARCGDAAGIDRIGLDLERLQKAERQGHLTTWISDHDEAQLPAIGQALQRASLFARTNPINPGSPAEIDRLIANGAQVLMLPMFRTAGEADQFVEFVAGRAMVVLLVETAAAAARIRDIVRLPGVDEIHIGLNDLYLDIGLRSHFELLGSNLVDMLANTVLGAGLPLGIGGIGRLHDPRLPIPADLVYAQYARLGATRALVSRVFVTPDYTQLDLTAEVAAVRARLREWRQASAGELDQAREALRALAGEA